RPPPTSTLFPYTTLFRSVLAEHLQAPRLRVGAHPGGMRGDQDVFHVPERVVRGQRLRLKDIERRARNPPLLERLGQRRQIHDDADRKSTRLNSSHQITSY